MFLTLNTNAKSSLPDSSRYSIIKEHSSQLYFSPTDKELETLFEQISAFVKASKRKSNRGKRLKMKDYLFQVIPEVDKKGQRIITVHGMCHYGREGYDGWRENVIYIEDGGACFFISTYNISENGKFSLDYGCKSP